MSAARHADLLFTKVMKNGDSDLMAYCKREGIPHVPFHDLSVRVNSMTLCGIPLTRLNSVPMY